MFYVLQLNWSTYHHVASGVVAWPKEDETTCDVVNFFVGINNFRITQRRLDYTLYSFNLVLLICRGFKTSGYNLNYVED